MSCIDVQCTERNIINWFTIQREEFNDNTQVSEEGLLHNTGRGGLGINSLREEYKSLGHCVYIGLEKSDLRCIKMGGKEHKRLQKLEP